MTELTLDELGDFFVVGGVADQLGVLFVDELVHELRQIASTHRDLCDRVGNSVSFVDGDRVRDTFTGVEHCARCTTNREQRHNCLVTEVELGHLEFREPERIKILD